MAALPRSRREAERYLTTLYRVYDDHDELLYVGISDAVFVRFGQHDRNSVWASRAAKITLERFYDYTMAAGAETAAIEAENPVYNIMQRPRAEAEERVREYEQRRPHPWFDEWIDTHRDWAT